MKGPKCSEEQPHEFLLHTETKSAERGKHVGLPGSWGYQQRLWRGPALANQWHGEGGETPCEKTTGS